MSDGIDPTDLTVRMSEVLRYRRLRDEKARQKRGEALQREVDGVRNFAAITVAPTGTLTGLERGINPIAKAGRRTNARVPAIAIRSSPHKTGSVVTPWQDTFRPDRGYAHYWGDAKASHSVPPEQVFGNRTLLRVATEHMSPDLEVRRRTPPLLLFRSVARAGLSKGFVRFEGLAVVEGVDLRVQADLSSGKSFANYRFQLAILGLSKESEVIDWVWINDRRDSGLAMEQMDRSAPSSWLRWVQGGHDALPRLRRRVADLSIVPKREQLPEKGSDLDRILGEIYAHYSGNNVVFEALAEFVTNEIVSRDGARYVMGWITRRGGDGGTDFVGRIDLGSDFATTSLVLLGQAKCVVPGSVISGRDVARVVARLQRGYVGAFVTTGHFGRFVQREVIEDQFPVMLISGLQLAQTVRTLMYEAGYSDVSAFLSSVVDPTYDARVFDRDPDEVLLDP